MAATVTLADLRARVRSAADAEVGISGSALEDTELDRLINDGLSELHNLLGDAFGLEYFMKSATISISAGTATYDLPADFWQLLTLALTDGSSTVRVPRFEIGQLAYLQNAYLSGSGTSLREIRYCIRAKSTGAETAQLELQPTPRGSGWSIDCRYIPPLVKLDEEGGIVTIDGINGWEQYAITLAAIDYKAAHEEDVSTLVLKAQRIENMIRSLADRRDAGEAPGTTRLCGDDDSYDEETLWGDLVP